MTRNAKLRLLRNWGLALTSFLPRPAILQMPGFLNDWFRFRRLGGTAHVRDSYPCLADRTSSTGFDAHYFYQAAWLARNLAANRPERHVDIGSDIRMINVLSAFVPTEFLDYRPLPVSLPGLTCGAADLVALSRQAGSIDSLSCLHVIEHVGLGRYGDPVDLAGSGKAAAELARVLAPGGKLFVSVPVGRARVCFNAHRIFDPEGLLFLFPGLQLEAFSFVDDAGVFHPAAETRDAANNEYACGMYVLSKSK